MAISEYYDKSVTKKVLSFLFVDKKEYAFTDSKIMRLLSVFSSNRVAAFFSITALVILWYEGLFGSLLGINYLSKVPLLLLTLSFIFVDKEKIRLGKVHFWYALFGVIALVSAIFALMRGIQPFMIFFGLVIFGQLFLAVSLGQALGKKIFKPIILLSVPLAVFGIYQFITKAPMPAAWLSSYETEVSTRAFAFFGSPNVLGALLAPVAVVSFFEGLKSKKYFWFVFSAVNVIAVVLTFSRSAWIGLAAAVIYAAIFIKPKALILMVFAPIVLVFSQIRERLAVSFSQKYLFDSYLDGRVWAWINGLHIFGSYPLIGTGPGTYGGQIAMNYASPVYLEGIQNGYTALYFTDNQFLELLVQAGILGLFAFTGFIVSILVALTGRSRQKQDIMALAAASTLVCFLVSGLFANVLEFGAVAVPVGLILGAGLSNE